MTKISEFEERLVARREELFENLKHYKLSIENTDAEIEDIDTALKTLKSKPKKKAADEK